MVNKDNEPHGFGRMIKTDKSIFYEGQFENGRLKVKGYGRYFT